MAEKSSKPASGKKRRRYRVNLSLTPEQYAQLKREVPKGDYGAYCKERIFSPWGLRDPVIEVGARLLGRTAQARRLIDVLDVLERAANQDRAQATCNGDETDDDWVLGVLATTRHVALIEAIGEARELITPLFDDVREIERIIVARQEQAARTPTISQRKRG